jgi:hypothetical protein
MIMKTEAEIQELFKNKLDDGEEILLMGSYQHKNLDFVWQDGKSMWALAIVIIIFCFWVIIDRMSKGEEFTAAIQFAFCVAVPATILCFILPLRKPRVRKIPYYAVTTKRFFIYEAGNFNSYSLYRFTDFIVSKAKDGFSDVSLYTGNTVTGGLADPIFTLKNLFEGEAQDVYKTLIEAREESQKKRAMGIE